MKGHFKENQTKKQTSPVVPIFNLVQIITKTHSTRTKDHNFPQK